jgi:hypothetical protein
MKSGLRIPDIDLGSLTNDELKDLVEKLETGNVEQYVNKMVDPFFIPEYAAKPPKIIHYPINLANCGTTDGNVKVLEEFCRTLDVENEMDKPCTLSYCPKTRNFDLKESRKRKHFINKMAELINGDSEELNQIEDEDGPEQSEDLVDFEMKYKEIRQVIANATDVTLLNTFDLNVRDAYGRSYLHLAAEFAHLDMIDVLFQLGFNPNVVENIGITPLAVAVIKDNSAAIKMLLECGADCQFSIPSAYYIAKETSKEDILHTFDELLNNQHMNIQQLRQYCSIEVSQESDEPEATTEPTQFKFDRKRTQVPVYGDNGVEKQIRSIKNRSGKFSSFCECPGDLHASAYAFECMAKCMGTSGMFYILAKVLKRKNNADTFGSLKLQEGNMASNSEACRDIAFGYGLALFLEFKNTDYFPLENAYDETLIFHRFKLFIKDLRENDCNSYYLQAVLLFGPWLAMYKKCIRKGYGKGREVVWLISVLIFGPMQKKNYFCSAIVHCVNFCYAWPRLIRDVVRDYSSISVSGRDDHMLAVDEYVESRLVKPLKMYATGHTTVGMLKMLSANGQIIYKIRTCYLEAFADGATRPHKTPDALADQLKVAGFALKHDFFKKSLSSVNVFTEADEKTEKKVGKNLFNIEEKGQVMLEKKFSQKMFTYFSEWRNQNF